jgi:hypothetical protein
VRLEDISTVTIEYQFKRKMTRSKYPIRSVTLRTIEGLRNTAHLVDIGMGEKVKNGGIKDGDKLIECLYNK